MAVKFSGVGKHKIATETSSSTVSSNVIAGGNLIAIRRLEFNVQDEGVLFSFIDAAFGSGAIGAFHLEPEDSGGDFKQNKVTFDFGNQPLVINGLHRIVINDTGNTALGS